MKSWWTRVLAVLAGTGIFHALEVVADLPAKLGEHAIVGWINEQLADHFGIRSPSIADIVRRVLDWGPAFTLAVICFSGWAYAFRLRRQRHHASEGSPAAPTATAAPSPPEPVPVRPFNAAVLARVKTLLWSGDSLLTQYSFMGDSDPKARSKLVAWLIGAGEITPTLKDIGRAHFADQIAKAIDDASSGTPYKKVQLVHAIMSELANTMSADGS